MLLHVLELIHDIYIFYQINGGKAAVLMVEMLFLIVGTFCCDFL